MSNQKMAYDLFKFLQKVPVESLQESTDKAYSKKIDETVSFKRVVKETAPGGTKTGKVKFTKKVEEGKLVDDPSQIDNPEKQIQTLAEDSLKEPVAQDKDIKTANAGITEKPEEPKVETDIKKEAGNDIDKLTQGKDGLDPDAKTGDPKVKEEKKITPEVSSVKKEETPNPGPDGTSVKEDKTTEPTVKTEKVPVVDSPEQGDSKKPLEVSGLSPEKAKNEGKLVDDPSQIDNPEKQIQTLAEERVLTTVSDENVAKDIQSKYPGSRIVSDQVNGKPQWIIMVKESTKEKSAVKEDVNVCVTTEDGKKVDITSSPAGTTVTTSDGGVVPTEEKPKEEVPVEKPKEETKKEKEEKAEDILVPSEQAEEDDITVAEKLYVVELLKNKTSLTEKEKNFIKAVESIKLDEAKKIRVNEKLVALKNRTVKK